MPLLISDETLKALGMTEQEAKVEIVCRWFDAGKMSFGHAAEFAGLFDLVIPWRPGRWPGAAAKLDLFDVTPFDEGVEVVHHTSGQG